MTPRDRTVLEFEHAWAASKLAADRGEKHDRVWELFDGMSPTRYYQTLNRLADDPDAMVEFPQLVGRLRRLRATRRAARDTITRPRHLARLGGVA